MLIPVNRRMFTCLLAALFWVANAYAQTKNSGTEYRGEHLSRVAFPIGGIGAGMFCLEGSGAISHFSIYNNPDIFNEPPLFAALRVGGKAKVLEGPVPEWKKYGMPDAALGAPGATWGLARFSETVSCKTRFPFATVELKDKEIPVNVSITGWSPFIPTDADNSGLPVGALEYTISNRDSKEKDFVFSYNAKRFDGFSEIAATDKGFVFNRPPTNDHPEGEAHFAVFTDEPRPTIDYSWFRGGWFDPLTVAWDHIQKGIIKEVPPQAGGSGSSIMIPFSLEPGESKTISIYFCWYVPTTRLRIMTSASPALDSPMAYHAPFYSSRFKNIRAVIRYWKDSCASLKKKTQLFSAAFYKSTLPAEVTDAVAANLCILKSPTVLRQYDGRFWGWEGCEDREGSCPGSCTHVWNYAQALSHLFPTLERSLRETEFGESQNEEGHQMFRSALPIRPLAHDFYAAADGQLGGILKIYRDWRISGDSDWLKKLYPRVKRSLDYCIGLWDPRHQGVIEEPHHNTYDIEFWGPEPMCTGIYLGALEAMIRMANYLGEDSSMYKDLLSKGRDFLEKRLYNGDYFHQQTQWTGLSAPDPVTASKNSFAGNYSEDALAILKKEGPKYQYGTGCLSDGMIGLWMARVCGLNGTLDRHTITRHLLSVYKFNFRKDLSGYSNPQRPTYALGHEGGLLLCSWPRGGKPTLPFPYSNEVWSGIEYEVASHLIMMGRVKEGSEIVRTCRNRYDGRVRNPFDEYECGHWYARAMSSYALIQALTGVRYDAVEKTLYVDSRIGDFVSFLSTDTGFGNVIYKNGKVKLNVVYGQIGVQKIIINHFVN